MVARNTLLRLARFKYCYLTQESMECSLVAFSNGFVKRVKPIVEISEYARGGRP